MKSIPAAVLVILISGCVSAPPKPTPTPSSSKSAVPVTLTDADRASVEAGMLAALQGPPGSATFRTMSASKGADGVVTVCGYVNAKNSSGGNTGDKPYIGVMTGTGFTMTQIGGADAETIAVQTACAQHRIAI